MSDFTSGWATHVGRVRRDNEDACYVGRRVWAVADGMGGHAAGEVASALAVDAMAELDAADGVLTRDAVVEAVQRANDHLLEHGGRQREARGMGTTLTGVALVEQDGEERLCVFNVGDSRVYRLSAGHLGQVTTDHSEVAELVAAGLISPSRARTHPLRNVVTRCLGGEHRPLVDTWLTLPRPGVRLLLCSDGLNGELPDLTIARLLQEPLAPQAAADALVEAALEAGGGDNVTVVVLDVEAAATAD